MEYSLGLLYRTIYSVLNGFMLLESILQKQGSCEWFCKICEKRFNEENTCDFNAFNETKNFHLKLNFSYIADN